MSFRLSGQTKILDETTANLIMAIALAMIFVYMVLAAQFESFVQPIVIMLVLPLSVPFALFTLWVTGRTLNLWSALGVLLLLGIVKKNSILQVDYANVLRAHGHAAARRDRRGLPHPPAADPDDDVGDRRRADPDLARPRHRRQGRAAIAVTIIGGRSLCLFLTLLLVPVAYVKLDALEQASTTQRIKASAGHAITSTVGRLRPARRDADDEVSREVGGPGVARARGLGRAGPRGHLRHSEWILRTASRRADRHRAPVAAVQRRRRGAQAGRDHRLLCGGMPRQDRAGRTMVEPGIHRLTAPVSRRFYRRIPTANSCASCDTACAGTGQRRC